MCFIIDGKKKYNPVHTIFDFGFSGFSINSITFSLWIFTTPLLRAISSFTLDITIVCVVDLDNFVINSSIFALVIVSAKLTINGSLLMKDLASNNSDRYHNYF